jgi:hypothetical protein
MKMKRLESCPRCGTKMKGTKEPLKIRGTYVGLYEAMSCPICKYHYFTEAEYDLALYTARSLGIVGPPLLEISSVVTSEKLNIESIFRIDKPSNSISKEGSEEKWALSLVELPPLTISHDVVAPAYLDTRR